MRSTDFDLLHIPIASVKQGDRHFEFCVSSFPDLTEGLNFPDGISVRVDIQTIGDDFLVDLGVEGEGYFACDRCGKSFHRAVKGKIQTLFSFGKSLNLIREDDEIKLLQPSDTFLDIARDAADALILSIPAKILCDGRCKGLCPACGADLNSEACSCPKETSDSPWDALKNIKFD